MSSLRQLESQSSGAQQSKIVWGGMVQVGVVARLGGSSVEWNHEV